MVFARRRTLTVYGAELLLRAALDRDWETLAKLIPTYEPNELAALRAALGVVKGAVEDEQARQEALL